MVKRWDASGLLEVEECKTGDFVLHTDYAVLQASHARLLEALVKIERRTFQHSDDDAADHKRNLYHAHSIARHAIAAAQPFTET